jgi:lysosomal Pro-X carboxypeptidase
MFLPQVWNKEETINWCLEMCNLKPRFNWGLDNFGGRNPEYDFAFYSNIIFSDWEIDPFIFGGLIKTSNDKLLIIVTKDAANGLYLQAPNDYDPVSHKEAR